MDRVTAPAVLAPAPRPRSGADVWLPLALLGVALAAVWRELGPWMPAAVVVALVAGTVWRLRTPPGRAWIWAGMIPLAVRMAWAASVAPETFPAGTAFCADPLSPPTLWRIAEACVVLGSLGIAALAVGCRPSALRFRPPSRAVLVASAVTPIVVVPAALLLGPVLARPFFGPFTLEVGLAGAIVPALAFAVANGTMEEVVYRGALLSWSARVVGPGTALWLQAVVFGLAHAAGRDFVGSPVPVAAALVAAGLVAGTIVRRTGSLALVIAIHVACDVPLYYYQACRLA